MATGLTTMAASEGRLRVRERSRPSVDADFAEAVDQHARDLARFAYLICGDRAQAEEAVAEAFTKAWPRWRRGKIDTLIPYVKRSIVYEIYGRSRRRKLERREEQLHRAAGPDGRFEHHIDERSTLWPLVARLPVQQRAVIVLRIVEDLSEEQTAELIGVPVGTVKSRLSRALTNLRAMMEDPS
jgi:RNA polymerase sigma-70 factor (sigma-E family)